MTCILVAHLVDEIIIAADKRVTLITPDGVKSSGGDDEEKIVRTKVGVITGTGSVDMLDHVKTLVKNRGFTSPDEVLRMILDKRSTFSGLHADSSRLKTDLAQTSFMFTYPAMVNDQPVMRFVYYHQSHSTDSLCRLEDGKVMCFPGGFSLEQAIQVQDRLQGLVTPALESGSIDEVRTLVISYMRKLMKEISDSSETVSSICDIAVIKGRNVKIAMSVGTEDEVFKFVPMTHLTAS
ncbi:MULTISPECIES: hypothetical protein [Pseudomonas syringae group]|uniref:Uncharacterized protein n=1 Tax=Pseudomonas syringae TaxID=317 RepID=A0A2K4WVT7_PSESX|nr:MULTISPECIES: hypothetical protein [Pseudomonas syringae group]KWS54872.1 hypothetical protein AL056_06245 [Pseudomonas amygdali pv. morsprunorum]KWS68168.1 hypothetical protein AL054_20070 [Pseudomonas amygdali pv. morsprunorum]MBI6732892.1 hypothetical protein [Pseudomonas amygdali]MBI6814975.1 hypothetical protein [Pseudomonas amygdali]PHX28844.1 hypothetical protein AO282_06315 [Pseudomonas amygdali pv. morsprunorum]